MFITKKLKHIVLSMFLLVPLLTSIVTVNNTSKTQAATGITNIGHIGGYDHPMLVASYNIAIDSLGNIFVSGDGGAYNGRPTVNKYSSAGVYQNRLGSIGTGDGQFNSPPRGLAIDSTDNIYVVESLNNRVQKFDSGGVYQSQFGSAGSGDSQFSSPNGIAIDSSNNIFVVDSGNNRVQKFDNSGAFISKWGSAGSGDGQFGAAMNGLSIDSNDNVFVTDRSNGRIQKFNNSGVYQSQFATSQLYQSSGIALDAADNIYVSGIDDSNFLGRVVKYNSSGSFQSYFGGLDSDNEHFGLLSSVTTDISGNVITGDQILNRIQKFSDSGTYQTKWGSSGSGDGQFDQVAGVVADSNSNIYAIDNNNHRIQKFDSSGAFLSKWGSAGSGDGQFSSTILGITVDSDNNIYVADSGNNRIQKFDSSGAFLSKWGSAGSGDGQLSSPAGLSTDSSNNLYVADSGNNRIQKFNSSGAYLSQFGSAGSGDGQLSGPLGVSVTATGNIYVADTDNVRIQKFNSSGVYQNQYTESAGLVEIPLFITSLKATANGRIYVADTYDFRVEILCDNDVSSDGCNTPSGGGSGSGVTVANAVNGQSINIDQANCSPASSVTAIKSSTLSKPDAGYSYPTGLVNYTLNGCPTGGSATMTVKFAGVSNPTNYKLRKYNASTQSYGDVPNVTLSTTTLAGVSAIQASYTITDGGPLDADGVANGVIVDPVGLASVSPLANTGAVAIATTVLLGLILGSLSYTYYDYRKHKKPLLAEDPHINYTFVHHIKVVSIPLIRYRLQFQLQKVEHGSGMVHRF